MKAICDSTRLARVSDILPAQLDNELVLMDIDQGKYFGLADTALHIWNLVEPPCSFGELCGKLREHYRDPAGQIESDARIFVDKLVAQKLIILS